MLTMPSMRARVLISFVVVIAVVQIALEDVIIFFGATGRESTVLDSPLLMIALPFVLFLLLAGGLYGWAIGTDETLR